MPGKTPNNLPYPLGTDLVVNGDNAIRDLANALKMCAGSVTVTGTGAVFATAAVVFPVGLFTTPPIVVAQSLANTSGTVLGAQAYNVTAAGCSIRVSTAGGFATGYSVSWIAFANAPAALAADDITQLPDFSGGADELPEQLPDNMHTDDGED